MIRHCLAYRFQDESVAGFIGYRFGGGAAEDAAIANAKQACENRSEPFDRQRIISKAKQCSAAEHAKIKADWKAIRKAIKEKGGSIY